MFASICVYCGSSSNAKREYFEAAERLGIYLANQGIALVYGGAHSGLMGSLADAMLGRGGRVIGVIPKALVEREIAHRGLSELHVVESMHERKAMMYALAEAFVAMPGGFGTLDELFETLTWAQLKLHAKPVGLLNVSGYFDPLLALCDRAQEEGFMHPLHRAMLLCGSEPEDLLRAMKAFVTPETDKWWLRS